MSPARMPALGRACRALAVLPIAGLALAACAGDRVADAAAPGMPVIERATPSATVARLQPHIATGLDEFEARMRALEAAAAALGDDSASARALQDAFIAARLAFKRSEFAFETWVPTATEAMNGPALPEIEDTEADRPYRPPEGFQVVEELIFPEPVLEERERLVGEIRHTAVLASRLRSVVEQTTLTDDAMFDGAKLLLARLVSLGLSGFDSPVARQSLPEGAASIAGIREALEAAYTDSATAIAPGEWRTLLGELRLAEQALDTASDFETFDRLAFIVRHARPAAFALDRVREALQVPLPQEQRLWRVNAPTPYEVGAWDPAAYAPATTPAATDAHRALGEALFASATLSGDGTRSCASCHVPGLAFTDGQRLAARLDAPSDADSRPLRNTPTLLNAALQPALNADGAFATLEDQLDAVVRDPREMGGHLDTAAARLAADPAMAARFAQAFGEADGASVTSDRIRWALAAYLRSLQSFETPFDRALRGDTLAISESARRGFTVFMGKGLCGTCHFAPLFNGVVPVRYEKVEYEVLGTPATAAWRGARVSPDSGRGRIYGNPLHTFAVKTPSARNAAHTAPFMHNGVYRSIGELLRFYKMGGGEGIGVMLEHQTLPADRLDLTARDSADLEAFLHALSDPRDGERRVAGSR